MHELSVALRIVEALDQELVGEEEGLVVTAVSIQIGTLTGIVPEALQFCWDMATENGLLQGSKLDIQIVEATGYCAECNLERPLTNLQSMRCPICQSPITQISGGSDLEILTVTVESPDDA